MALTRRNDRTTGGTRPQLLEVRPLTREDLKALQSTKKIPINRVQQFRDSHHRLARILAAGIRPQEAAEMTGYSISTVHAFQADPAFKELVAKNRPEVSEVITDVLAQRELLTIQNGIKAERRLADRLDDEDDDRITTRDLITIARDAADRTGLGKRSTVNNVNIDLARSLEAANARRSRAGLTIDNVPSSPASLSGPVALPKPTTATGPTLKSAPIFTRRGL